MEWTKISSLWRWNPGSQRPAHKNALCGTYLGNVRSWRQWKFIAGAAMCVSVFRRGRKQRLLLWGCWCYSVENRDRKHAYFRHFVFFPWRCNKVKRFPLHTHFLFVWRRERKGELFQARVWHLSLLQKAGAPRCSERLSCLAAAGEQNASLVSDIKLLCWKPSQSWCDKWILPAAEKHSPHLSAPPALPNLAPRSPEQKAALRHHLFLPAPTRGPAFTSVK